MNFVLLQAAPAAGAGSLLTQMALPALLLVVMYFMLFMPQKKQEKKQQEMRANLEVGDEITTIGGIVGRVISMKDDTVLLETGGERTRIRVKRAAIQTVEKLDAQ